MVPLCHSPPVSLVKHTMAAIVANDTAWASRVQNDGRADERGAILEPDAVDSSVHRCTPH
jgi:hypothetical protein